MSELEDLEAAMFGEPHIRVQVTDTFCSCPGCGSYTGKFGLLVCKEIDDSLGGVYVYRVRMDDTDRIVTVRAVLIVREDRK